MANENLTEAEKRKRKQQLARKKAAAHKQAGSIPGTGNDVEDYKARLARHRRESLRRIVIGAVAVILVIGAVWLFFEKRTYSGYRAVSSSSQEDTTSTKYVEMAGKILRYNSDGASLVSTKQETLWTSTYEMQNPVAHICGDTAVIADQEGTAMAVFDENGQTGTITTSYNIVKARVASQGVVAVILDGGEDTWINFYASDGSLIAENQTRVDDPGYPMDIAVSPDGLLIMVAYQFVDGGKTTSKIAFYNFGTAGQNQIDNIVSGYTYEDVVVPQVEYLNSSLSVAFRDDGFTIYNGKQIPKEIETIEVDKEIVSTFHDDSHIGLVFKEDGKDKMYKMEVYNTSGKMVLEKSFNIPYTTIKMTGGQIVMFNSSQACVINGNGNLKFDGNIDEGAVRDFFKIGMNKYLLVLDNGVSVIKLT